MYTFENMKQDSINVFKKYHDLTKYTPERPDEEYRIRIDNNDNISDEDQE